MKTKYWMTLLIVAAIFICSSSLTLAQDTESLKLDINSVSSEVLQNLPGIDPVLAEAIINGRPYLKPEDLLNVKGVDEKMLAEIQKLIEVKKLNVNTATLEELQTLPGVTAELAEAIIKGRPYTKVEDLLNVKEMSEETLEKFQDYIEARLEKKRRAARGRKSRSKKTGSTPPGTTSP